MKPASGFVRIHDSVKDTCHADHLAFFATAFLFFARRDMWRRSRNWATVLAVLMLAVTHAAMAASLSSRDVTSLLFHASRLARPDLSSKDLKFLDLAGLDFKRARLAHSDLTGADLTEANLSKADLKYARLDRATLLRANFKDADLREASLLSSTAFSGKEGDWSGAPNFSNADLSGARIAARLDGAIFKGANLTDAIIGPQPAVWGSYAPRAVLNGCNFSGAILIRTNLSNTSLQYADFSSADLRGADLSKSDLSQADLSGADLAGANITDADFDGAKLIAVKGLDSAVGLATAHHLTATSETDSP